MRGPLLIAIDRYNQELSDRLEAFMASTRLPLDIKEFNPFTGATAYN